jgi:hypothetical protein
VDRIRAEVVVPGLEEPAVAEATIQIRAPNAEGLLFVGANPADIALRGRGTATRPDRSTVTFRVQNASGVPVQNARVVFALSGRVGDASLRYPEATSDAAGEVRAIVDAGDFAAALSVQATTVGAGGIVYTAMSQQITISTGGADQDSMSLSVETFNIEGWNFDGVTTGINVRAADRFNNPVADGTRLSFIAEGGAVQPSCATQGGACSVLLTSQNPRPSDGRVSVLVRTEGSESFVDANGNGMYDLGESFTDLPEAWLDSDEDGTRDSNEAFSDYNNNGVYDGPNGRFDGGPCTVPSQCGLAVDVRAQTVVVFSTSRALVQILPTQIRVDDVSPVSVVVLVSDEHGNLPPAGTKVDIETGNGEIAGATSFTIGNTNARGPLTYQFQIIGDGEASTGTLNVDVTSPAGFVSRDQATVIDTTQNITVGDVRITPQTVTVAAGTVTEQNIAVTITQGATGIAGVTPGFACEAGTSVGLLVESIAAVQPTDGAGATMLRVRATAAANASGDVVCAVRAGDKSANLTIRGPSANASAPGVLTVSPTQVTVQPGQTGFAVNPLMTLVNAETPGRPIAGFYPVVRCQNINATQLTVTPGVVTPTDANGQTVLSFFYTTGAAPTGEAVCEVVAGSLRQEIRFVP